MRVYLAGGLRSGWQDDVMAQVPGHDYIDPRTHAFNDPKSYTDWDCAAIARSELVFAYLEPDNPGSWNTIFELGIARALQLPVIFVDAKSRTDILFERYSAMAQVSATVYVSTLVLGIDALRGYTERNTMAHIANH